MELLSRYYYSNIDVCRHWHWQWWFCGRLTGKPTTLSVNSNKMKRLRSGVLFCGNNKYVDGIS